MPLPIAGMTNLPAPDGRAVLDHMPGSSVPVIRQPFMPGDPLPFWAMGHGFEGNHLWDHTQDPDELHDLAGAGVTSRESDHADLLVEALRAVEAPDDQFVHLGLS